MISSCKPEVWHGKAGALRRPYHFAGKGSRHIACFEQFNGQFGCVARQNTERACGRAGQEGDDAYFHGACVLGLHRWHNCNQTGSDGCRNLGLAEHVDIYSGLIDSSSAGSSGAIAFSQKRPMLLNISVSFNPANDGGMYDLHAPEPSHLLFAPGKFRVAALAQSVSRTSSPGETAVKRSRTSVLFGNGATSITRDSSRAVHA